MATTVIRYSRLGEEVHGRTFDVDMDRGKVKGSWPTPDPMDTASNPNPRGGIRGGRGIQLHGDEILVTNHDTIFRHDMDMKPLGKISHRLSAGIHEIFACEDGIWVAATDIDSVVKLDYRGKLLERWCFHSDRKLAGSLGMTELPEVDWRKDHRRSKDELLDRGHLNGVIVEPDGRLVVTLGLVAPRPAPKRKLTAREEGGLLRRVKMKLRSTDWYRRRQLARLDREGALIEVRPGSWKARLLFRNPALVPDHNGVPFGDGELLLNKTGTRELLLIDRGSGEVKRSTRLPGNWLRGMDLLGGDRVVVGTGPPALHIVDARRGKVLRTVKLGSDPNESVHGICVVEK